MPVGRSSSPTHQQGAKAEDAAAIFMQQQGYQLIAQNFNTRFGEIDLIVERANQLVFVEVRQRKANSLVSALESITMAKQRKIIRAAQGFLQQHPQYQQHSCRFDVIACTSPRLPTARKRTTVQPATEKPMPDQNQLALEQFQSVPFQPVQQAPLQLEWIQAAFDSA